MRAASAMPQSMTSTTPRLPVVKGGAWRLNVRLATGVRLWTGQCVQRMEYLRSASYLVLASSTFWDFGCGCYGGVSMALKKWLFLTNHGI